LVQALGVMDQIHNLVALIHLGVVQTLIVAVLVLVVDILHR
jgi:hypothetical protein